MSESEDDDSYDESEEESPRPSRRRADDRRLEQMVKRVLSQQTAPRLHPHGHIERTPPVMGGSMCAQVSNHVGMQMSHPSAHTLTQMATTFQPPPAFSVPPKVPVVAPKGPVVTPNVPVVARIGGPARVEPQPFDNRAPMYGELTSTYAQVNEQPRPMSNIPNWQTPVLPFSKSKDTSPYDTSRSPFQLMQSQGFDQDSFRPKREQAPMFTPQQQNTFGMPSQAQVQRNRYEPSLELKHQKPFEGEWSLRTGGFHPTTRVLPTNVPVLRQQLTSNRVEGPTHATSHPSGLFGTNRGELGLVEKRKYDMSCYYKVPFPTSAPNPAAPKYAPTIAKATSRQTSSRPYGGVADGNRAAYVKGQHFVAPQALPSQLHERMQQAGGPGLVAGGATTAHFMDEARATLLEGTEMATMQGGARAPVASGTVHPMDQARPTMLEGTEQQVRSAGLNGGYVAPTTQFMDQARTTTLEGTELYSHNGAPGAQVVAPSTYYMDEARATMLEGTESQVRASAMQAHSGPTMQFMDSARATLLEGTELQTTVSNPGTATSAPLTYLMDAARATLKQWTSDHSYEGGVGNADLQAPLQSHDFLQNAVLNEKLEAAMDVQRAPAMGGNVDVEMGHRDRIGYGDASTVRVRPDFLPNTYNGMANRTGESQTRWIPTSTVSDSKAVEESWMNERNAPFVLTGLAQNPYAQPMWNAPGAASW